MALIEWSDNLSVKINSIDEQHQTLVGMVNELHDSMEKGDSKDELGKVLGGLAGYTVKHFGYEENLFDKHGYPETDDHKKEHSDLINQVQDLQNRYKTDESFTLGSDVMEFLKNWLTNHIQGTDKKYSSFLQDNGVS